MHLIWAFFNAWYNLLLAYFFLFTKLIILKIEQSYIIIT